MAFICMIIELSFSHRNLFSNEVVFGVGFVTCGGNHHILFDGGRFQIHRHMHGLLVY
jgi:hypothetical protein